MKSIHKKCDKNILCLVGTKRASMITNKSFIFLNEGKKKQLKVYVTK